MYGSDNTLVNIIEEKIPFMVVLIYNTEWAKLGL